MSAWRRYLAVLAGTVLAAIVARPIGRWLAGPPDETDWWFPMAEAAFSRLVSDLDFKIVERHYHFHGNYIVFERPDSRFVIEAGSDWNSLYGMLAIGPAGHRRGGEIEDMLASVDPTRDWRYDNSSDPLDRVAMAAKMDQWATGIVDYLPTLLTQGVQPTRRDGPPGQSERPENGGALG